MSSSQNHSSSTHVDEAQEALNYVLKRKGRRLDYSFMAKLIERSDELRVAMQKRGQQLGVYDAKRRAMRQLLAEHRAVQHYYDDQSLYSSGASHVFNLRKNHTEKNEKVVKPEEQPSEEQSDFYHLNAARIGERD